MRIRLPSAMISPCLVWLVAAVAALSISLPCPARSNQFVILSDLHISGGHDRANVPQQMEKVAREVLEIRPAFVVILGDVGGESMANTTLSCDAICEMKLIDAALRKWREAGIEIHVAVGNHDVPQGKPEVAAYKRSWFASQFPPYPMNASLDATINPETWKRYFLEKQYYYAFTWHGIQFVIMDSNDIERGDGRDWDIAARQREWLVKTLCQHEGNPSQYPSLVFMHHPEWMSGDRGCTFRPLYRVLGKNPDGHSVKAVFGGHYHRAQYWPPEDNLGVHVYATPATVLCHSYTEYIVATVSEDRITFERRLVAPPQDGRMGDKVEYHPIPGTFHQAQKRSTRRHEQEVVPCTHSQFPVEG